MLKCFQRECWLDFAVGYVSPLLPSSFLLSCLPPSLFLSSFLPSLISLFLPSFLPSILMSKDSFASQKINYKTIFSSTAIAWMSLQFIQPPSSPSPLQPLLSLRGIFETLSGIGPLSCLKLTSAS